MKNKENHQIESSQEHGTIWPGGLTGVLFKLVIMHAAPQLP